MKLNLNPKFDKEIIKNLSKFLLEKFCELDICSIFIFGSSIYPGYLNEGYSDIDVGINVRNFERENLPKIYKSLNKINNTEILRQYFINHPQSIDKYTFLQNSAFTHWVKEKCSKMC